MAAQSGCMTSTEKRSAVRFGARFPAQLSFGKKAYSAETVDVAPGGVFIRSEFSPGVRQLVQVQLVPPPGDIALSFHAMVVHVLSEGNPHGRAAGLGVQFYAIDADTRSLWQRVIRGLEQAGAPQRVAAPAPSPVESPSVLRRRFVRHSAVLKLPKTTQEGLRRFYQQDLIAERTFVPFAYEIPLGKAVFVHIPHPNHAGTFLLEAVVEQSRVTPQPSGVVVKFVGLTPVRLQAFLDFIESGMDDESDVSDDAPTIDMALSALLQAESGDDEIIVEQEWFEEET